MLAGLKDARYAVLNSNLHLACQDKNPLGRTGAMKSAAKPYWTSPKLVSAACKHL